MLPSSIEIRPFPLQATGEHEYRALNVFENCIRAESLPDDPSIPLTEAIQRWQNMPTYLEVLQWAAWHQTDAAIVARGEVELWRTETNQHVAYFDIAVLPAFRRQGLARRLLALIVATAQAEKRRLLMAHTNERVPAGAAFMQCLDARPGLVGHTNQLVLAELDPHLLQCWQTQARERATAFELSCWIGAWPAEQIAEFSQLITAGMNQQPLGELQLEEFNYTPARIRQQEQLWAATGTERWTMIICERATGRAVGLTEVWWQPNRPTILQQGLTVVLPTYRNRGLGRWLKAAMLAKVVQDRPQVKVVRTGNADSNAAMLKINHALGFKPYLAGCFWQVDTAQVLSYLQ
jgi:mycothiol synthase